MRFVRGSVNGAAVHDGLFTVSSDKDAIIEYLYQNGFSNDVTEEKTLDNNNVRC